MLAPAPHSGKPVIGTVGNSAARTHENQPTTTGIDGRQRRADGEMEASVAGLACTLLNKASHGSGKPRSALAWLVACTAAG